MPKVIAILHQKGGVGKTTLAVHIATALARKSRSVLLLDADPQGSALDWAAARHGEPLFPVVGLPKSSIHNGFPALANNYNVVIIDGPPRVYDVGRSAIMASDLVLVPVQPSLYDVWAAKEIIDLLNEATVYKPSLQKAFVILNTGREPLLRDPTADFADLRTLPQTKRCVALSTISISRRITTFRPTGFFTQMHAWLSRRRVVLNRRLTR